MNETGPKDAQSEGWLKMGKTEVRKGDGRYVIFYSFPRDETEAEEVKERCQNSDGTQCSKNG